MATRKTRSKQQYQTALELEKAGDIAGAIKLYGKAATTDPLNVQAWNRQMILFRKTKSREEEVTLIRSAIEAYTKQTEAEQREWLKDNSEKAESSRELAKALGLLGENGMPATKDDIIQKWETRLYLLEYRINNARKKKATGTKKKAPIQAVKAIKPGKQSNTKKTAVRPAIKTKRLPQKPKATK